MSIEAMKQALEIGQKILANVNLDNLDIVDDLVDSNASLRQAIAEAEKQEPVACVNGCSKFFKYTHPKPKREPLTDAPLYLSNLVNALDNAFISSWQTTAHWDKELNEARDYLAAHGIKGDA